MRQTKQKDLILNIVNKSFIHPTANFIYKECQKELPNISLGTVYRNLNNLVNIGEIRRIKMPNNIDRFDKLGNYHSHFICYNCSSVIDLNSSNYIKEKTINGNQILDYEISFKGICKKCLDNKGGN